VEHPRFIGLDIHKERISVAVAQTEWPALIGCFGANTNTVYPRRAQMHVDRCVDIVAQ
jgi:hypothetical protein